MSKYIISYNPYKNATIVEKNGVQLKKNSAICKGLSGKRLQTWFDETLSWPGVGKVIDDDNNEAKCEIVFKGREIDYIDLRDYFLQIYKSEKNTEFILSAENLSSDEDMLSRLGELIEEAKNKKMFPKNQISDIEEHLSRLKTDPFVISVIAPMSSGKSTLLNALMHRELLPTGDKATTANIVEIYDDDCETIQYSTFDKNGACISEGDNADLDTFKSINSDDHIRTVKIHTDIPMVSAGRMSLMLRDTPGPNNSDDIRHKQITESIISDARNMSTVLYIMNATQLRVDSDYELLSSIAMEMKNGGKQANDRFLFVINRVDDWVKNPNQTLEGLLNETKDYLGKFGIDNPRIFLVTASLASNIWRYRNGYEFGKKEERSFNFDIGTFSDEEDSTIKFNEYAATSLCVERSLHDELEEAIKKDDEIEIAYIHSGLKGLEYSIREYMDKYAYPIKVSDAIADIIDTIDEKKMRTLFMDAITSDERKLEEVRKKINASKKKKEERLAKKKEFEEGLSDYGISDSLRSEAGKAVNEAFSDLIDRYTSQIRNQSSLKQEDARGIISDLQGKVREQEKILDDKLKRMIQKEVYEKGSAILVGYRAYLRNIEDDLGLPNFDFWKVKELKRSDFDDIRKVSDRVTSTEQLYKETRKKVKNPNYHRFLFWHWGGEKEIEKIEKTPNGVVKYVDRNAFLEDIIGIRVNATQNVNSIFQEAELLIEEFKGFFAGEIDKFNSTIDDLLEELNSDFERESKEEKSKEKHQKQLDELNDYMKRVYTVTEF